MARKSVTSVPRELAADVAKKYSEQNYEKGAEMLAQNCHFSSWVSDQ